MRVQCKCCDGYYKLRKGKYGEFAGCSNYPRCRSTMKLSEFLRASGQEPGREEEKLPLPERYVAFDVETPNAANARMSAIGIAVVEHGKIVEEFTSLVDPETHFDGFNVRLTGITPAMAAEAPTFAELWPTLEPLLSSGLLVAHNAPFDMGVLAKCLRSYGIHWKDTAQYACTVRISRKCFPSLPDHKLNTLCDYLGISLDHHQAGSDSRACAQVLLRCLEAGADLGAFCRSYDL